MSKLSTIFKLGFGSSLLWAIALLGGSLTVVQSVSGATILVVEGNLNLSRRKIEAAISLPENPRELSESSWAEWSDEVATSLSDLYSEIGYLDAAFRVNPILETDANGHIVELKGKTDADFRIRLQILEGVQYRFGAVVLKTTDQTPAVLPVQSLRSRPGRSYEKDLVFRDHREILSAFGDAGFLHCESTEKIKLDTLGKLVNVDFLVKTGPAVRFDSLIVRNTREGDSTGRRGSTGDQLLKSLLSLSRGDTVRLATLAQFEKKLKSTRVFNYVRLRDSLIQDKGNLSALILSTEERIPGEMNASLFYETQYGVGVSADWAHGNIWGQLHEARIGGSFAQRKQSTYLGYSSPLFFRTSFRFDNDLIADWYQDSRVQQGVGPFAGDFDITNSSKLSKSFTYWLRDVETAELTGKSVKIDTVARDRAFNLNFINSLFFSFLDDVVSTTKGARLSLTWGNGGAFLKDGQLIRTGQIKAPVGRRHNWLEVETGLYYPIAKRLKLAFRLDGGRFFGVGGLNSERFFLGGPRSVRSYGWRQICPNKDAVTGVCLQEDLEPAYFLSSLEFRTDPFSPAFINRDGRWRYLLGLQVVPFLDYGNIWEVGKPLTTTGQGRAYGLGIRYSLLSIFNVRLDYSMDGPERKHDQWVLDLAQAF